MVIEPVAHRGAMWSSSGTGPTGLWRGLLLSLSSGWLRRRRRPASHPRQRRRLLFRRQQRASLSSPMNSTDCSGATAGRLRAISPAGGSELQRLQQRRGSLLAEQITWQRLARLLAVEAPCERLTFQVIRELNGDDERAVGLVIHEPSGRVAMVIEPVAHRGAMWSSSGTAPTGLWRGLLLSLSPGWLRRRRRPASHPRQRRRLLLRRQQRASLSSPMNSTDCSGATAGRLRAISPMLGPRPGASSLQRQDGKGSHRTTGRIWRGWSRQGPGLLSPMPSAGWKTRLPQQLIGVNSEKQRVTKRVAVQASGAEPLST